MSITTSVYNVLKPKVASFGFTQKELQSAAAVIADNLNLDENATEEVVTTAIDKAVNTMIPFLQLAQSQASRSIEKFKTEQAGKSKRTEDELDTGDDDTEPKRAYTKKNEPTPKLSEQAQNTTPEWANGLIDTVKTLQAELLGLKNEKLSNYRKQKLEEALKDTGAFGKQTIRSFNKMKFDSDDEFDEYLSDVENSVKDYRKEQSNANLKTMEKHPAIGGENSKELTDSEIDKIVNAM